MLTFSGLDMDQVRSVLNAMIAVADEEIGTGVSSQLLLDHMVSETYDFLVQETHQWTPFLFSTYRIAYDEDKGGLRWTIYVDPAAVNPVTGERPFEYAAIEFGKGGTHDTFELASLHFDYLFDKGFDLFANHLQKELGLT